MDSYDPFRFLWDSFDFLPQPADVNVDHLRLANVFCSPHIGKQILCGKHLSRVQQERVQQVEFTAGEFQWLAAQSSGPFQR